VRIVISRGYYFARCQTIRVNGACCRRNKDRIDYDLLHKSMKAGFNCARRLHGIPQNAARLDGRARSSQQGSVKLDKRAATFIASVYHGCSMLHAFELLHRREIASSPRLYRPLQNTQLSIHRPSILVACTPADKIRRKRGCDFDKRKLYRYTVCNHIKPQPREFNSGARRTYQASSIKQSTARWWVWELYTGELNRAYSSLGSRFPRGRTFRLR